jgi:hypothetical protein
MNKTKFIHTEMAQEAEEASMALEVNPETAVTIRALAAATEAVTANVRKINETMDRCAPFMAFLFLF